MTNEDLVNACSVGDTERVELLVKTPGIDVNYCSDKYTPLIAASINGHVNIVQILLNHAANINCRDHDGRSPMHEASHKASFAGHIATTELLLNSGALPDTPDNKGFTPLMLASQAGKLHIVEQLLLAKVVVDAQNKQGATALMLAAGRGHAHIVELLLEHAAAVNHHDHDSKSPLRVASFSGHLATTELLLKSGALPDTPDNKGFTPLMCASQEEKLHIVERLLLENVVIDAQNKQGATALMLAAQHDYVHIIEMLLKHKADVNHQDKNGERPLSWASSAGHIETTELLLKCGALPDTPDAEGFTPLMYASKEGHVNIVDRLLLEKVVVDAQNKQGATALILAAGKDQVKCLIKLLEAGADPTIAGHNGSNAMNAACQHGKIKCLEILLPLCDVNKPDKNGTVLLFYAIRYGHVGCADMLLQAGSDIEWRHANSRTALHEASLYGIASTTELLLEKGALVNSVTKTGDTALHLVSNYDEPSPGLADCVQSLLKHGADIHHTNNDGKTPLEVAEERGQTEISDILQNFKYPPIPHKPMTSKPCSLSPKASSPSTHAPLPEAAADHRENTRHTRHDCSINRLAVDFVNHLHLSEEYFDRKYDVCFCPLCHYTRGDNSYYSRGSPPKDYGLPIGWCKFGLKAPAKAFAENVFSDWHVAFHGTQVDSVGKILATGELLIPGDVTPDGHQLSIPKNHWDPKNPGMKPPTGHDVRKIYLSPSIHYSGDSVYAPIFSWNKTGFRVAFQVRIKPETYDVSDQTIGATTQIDPKIPNSELEWSTKRRGVTVLVGLLVKMDDNISESELRALKQVARQEPTLPQDHFLHEKLHGKKSTKYTDGSTIEITADYLYTGPRGEKLVFKIGETYKVLRQTDDGFWVEEDIKTTEFALETHKILIPITHAKLMFSRDIVTTHM